MVVPGSARRRVQHADGVVDAMRQVAGHGSSVVPFRTTAPVSPVRKPGVFSPETDAARKRTIGEAKSCRNGGEGCRAGALYGGGGGIIAQCVRTSADDTAAPPGVPTETSSRPPARSALSIAPISALCCSNRIPPNTGNVIRLCATPAPGCLVKPLGFDSTVARCAASGLDACLDGGSRARTSVLRAPRCASRRHRLTVRDQQTTARAATTVAFAPGDAAAVRLGAP